MQAITAQMIRGSTIKAFLIAGISFQGWNSSMPWTIAIGPSNFAGPPPLDLRLCVPGENSSRMRKNPTFEGRVG
jgi:hypothetical protein